MEIIKVVILSLSALLLLVVGATRLGNPVKAYLKNSGITLAKDVDLLNEMRGVSAVMLCGGIIIALGIIVPGLTFTSFVVASLLFLGFALGRVISMAADGKPNKQLIQGIWFEVILGAANVFGLVNTLV
ncbi:DUF4345 family protein [Spongiimicrobium sp. 2-473A-2-J]|uniref:DUF4345 family protein n=1 Tax=Eudoraea algarum TaxID=3417568 RepID=UPI003D35FD48